MERYTTDIDNFDLWYNKLELVLRKVHDLDIATFSEKEIIDAYETGSSVKVVAAKLVLKHLGDSNV